MFNGGAWLTVEGRRVDVHYRDLDVVEREVDRAGRGEFDVEPLLFHLAGFPTYVVVAELAGHRVLRGTLPRPGFPDALRRTAPEVWGARADFTLDGAEQHARAGRVAQCAGLVAVAVTQRAHAVLAGRGEWVTNESGCWTGRGCAGSTTWCWGWPRSPRRCSPRWRRRGGWAATDPPPRPRYDRRYEPE